MKIVLAKELRKKESLYKVPNDKPGWYKWWAPKKTIVKLLDSKYLDKNYLSCLLPILEHKNIEGEEYYYIYVGIAVKESIRARLNWHINTHHTESSVKSGFLSTLRQSISSLAKKDQYAEEETNKVIDTLIVEYETINLLMKDNKTKEKIKKIENSEMEKYVLPLNIQGNKNPNIQYFKKELKKVRKNAK